MMRANRVRTLKWLCDVGEQFMTRGEGHMIRWFEKHGLAQRGERGFGVSITDKGRVAVNEALREYDSKGRLTEVFPVR